MSRRSQTERQILEALEGVIRDDGMPAVGINAVARRAGVSKELIYRYFDGMPGLLLAWTRTQDFWTREPALLSNADSSEQTPAELVRAMLRGQLDALASNDVLREVRRWELMERTEVSGPLAERRERVARDFVDRIDGLDAEADTAAMVGVLLAGVLYLMLRSKTESHFVGLPLRTEAGHARIAAAVDHLVDRGFPGALVRQSLAALEAGRVVEHAAHQVAADRVLSGHR